MDGPRYSAGIPVNANKVVLSGDIVATDLYCQHILADHDLDFFLIPEMVLQDMPNPSAWVQATSTMWKSLRFLFEG